MSDEAGKNELRCVLNAFQNSPAYGVHVCEAFRDPRHSCMDDYWEDVEFEAFCIDDMHRMLPSTPSLLTYDARARLHQFARVLERLSKRIDRVVLGSPCEIALV